MIKINVERNSTHSIRKWFEEHLCVNDSYENSKKCKELHLPSHKASIKLRRW